MVWSLFILIFLSSFCSGHNSSLSHFYPVFFSFFPLFSSSQLESSPSLLLLSKDQNTTTVKQNNRKTSSRREKIWLHAASPDDISFYLRGTNNNPLTPHQPSSSSSSFPLSLSVKCLFLLKDFHFYNEQEVITYHILCWDSSPLEYFKLLCLPPTPFSFPLSITLLTWLLKKSWNHFFCLSASNTWWCWWRWCLSSRPSGVWTMFHGWRSLFGLPATED